MLNPFNNTKSLNIQFTSWKRVRIGFEFKRLQEFPLDSIQSTDPFNLDPIQSMDLVYSGPYIVHGPCILWTICSPGLLWTLYSPWTLYTMDYIQSMDQLYYLDPIQWPQTLLYYGIYKVLGLLQTVYTWIIYSPWTTLEPFIMHGPFILWTINSLWTTVDQLGDFPSDNFPRGNFPNGPFPKRQLPKRQVRPSEAPQASFGAAARMGQGAERCSQDRFGKLPHIWEVASRENTLGKMPFGKNPLWKVAYNHTMYSVFSILRDSKSCFLRIKVIISGILLYITETQNFGKKEDHPGMKMKMCEP